MKIDIVFISFNRKPEVQINLDKMSSYKNLNKIIWVDNGSNDGVESVVYNPEKVNFIKLQENIGIKAYNIGAAQSDADVLIILDDDSHVEEDALEKIAAKMAQADDLGALALKIVLPSTGEVVTRDWTDGPATHFWGCGAAVRRSVWAQLGGYREELFLYANEYDLCIRIWNAGYKVEYVSDITAYHRVSSMNRTSGRLVSYSIRNNYLFIKTYFDKKYQFGLFFYDRLTWFTRAILTGAAKAIPEGLKMIKDLKNKPPQYPIDNDIQLFYKNNLRLFEPPLKKVIRKFKHGSLFKLSKNV